ncbi:bifunctional diguanylate cyclase/phosphodiesterase [Blastococcus sp. TF02-8]|uniref:putative bifunctional diguanylate cyclase/phosphodiesterase n=1 Tax=Blastococcus sp. TF02-8 TaxID=2250574 RepID=UPI001411E11D|nr:bifunctional diguanylate cyclase/phosphodiesterase [Blastococcus sp. TF02-8]
MAVFTGLIAVGSVVWDLPRDVAAWADRGLPLDDIVFVLAASHLLMMGFGARRGIQLKREAAGRLAAEAAVSSHADRDALTGLASLSACLVAVARDHERRTPSDTAAAVMVDIDRFAAVNDTMGHEAGDALLVEVARRLVDTAPEGIVAARSGSDVFIAFFPADRVEEAAGVAAALRAALCEPYVINGEALDVDVSIGIAYGYGPQPTDLLRRADAARMLAKQQSAGIAVHDPRTDTFDPQALALHADLRRAVRDGGLSVHYQPKVRLVDGQVTGFEALIRWHHPQRGPLAPGQFIPLAEQTAIIGPLTDAVLERALLDCRRWHDAGRHYTVAVNVSPRLLQDEDFPGRLASLLREHDVHPHWLELEITETAALDEHGRALVVLDQLRLLGVQLSVDDFGTGHASLTHLIQLPITCLKIDRSFVARMDADPANRAIVRHTIRLAHALGLTAVAEGVEDQQQWKQLQEWGCDLAQGYWLGKAVPAEQLPGQVRDIERRCAPRSQRPGLLSRVIA